jgi:hypothetical protein
MKLTCVNFIARLGCRLGRKPPGQSGASVWPSLDDFHRSLLLLKLHELPTPDLRAIPDEFESFDEYEDVFRKLLLEEVTKSKQ